MRFRDFYYLAEAKSKQEARDLTATLKKIPKSHRKLVRGYDFSFQSDNTLRGEGDNIGSNDLDTKKIVISAPWNYGREFAILHEIGHMIWEELMCKHDKQEWKKIVNKTKHKVKQPAEELFCHAYANAYAKNKIEIHNHPEWNKFVKKISCSSHTPRESIS